MAIYQDKNSGIKVSVSNSIKLGEPWELVSELKSSKKERKEK